ncbi:retrovirus-related pol polyprotein from transposon TNT 1-94, partial [Tanacetum coccineum]
MQVNIQFSSNNFNQNGQDCDGFCQAETKLLSGTKPQRSKCTIIHAIFFHTTKCVLPRHKGKEIAKPVTPQSDSVSEEDSDPETSSEGQGYEKNLALLLIFQEAEQSYQQQLRTYLQTPGPRHDYTTPEKMYNNDKQTGPDKSVKLKFDKPSVVRQPNAQRIPKPSVLGKPTPFSNSPEMRSFQTKQSVNKTNVSDGLFKPVTQQSLPQNRNQAIRNTNVLKPGMYRIASTTTQTRTPQLPHASRNTNPHMSKSSGVIHTTSVSRPQLKSYQVKDKVVPNISQVKFTKKEVEDNHRISSISKKTKSVTACNDSSNSRTSNANAVCADCGKCVFNSDHDACVSRYLKDVNARTKKPKIVQLILFIVDSGCTKHMTGNLKLLCNFVEKFLGTVRFGNDEFAPILGYGDLIQGNVTIKRVYYVEGINHNLFSVSQFCDADLEVAFMKSTCFVRDLQGNNLLTGNRGSDLYTIYLQETTSSTLICFMAKASPTQAWLWHRRLSHLNFDYITLLSKKEVVNGLPKLKYVKDQLCSSCEMSKAKRSSFKTKAVPSSKGRL